MIRIVSFDMGGNMFPLFIDDTDTGYSGKDVLTKPGVYDDITSSTFTLPIAELSGKIDGYSTRLMGLIANQDPNDPAPKDIMDYTAKVKQLLSIPETAAKMLMARESQENKEFLQTAIDTIHYYESVTADTKVFLPEEAFAYVDPEVAKKMRSTRQVYVLKNSDNQEIVQRTCTDVYGLVLPVIEDLHSDMDVSPNALDVLRVLAPCRKEVTDGVFQYHGIYHTPYYRVDSRLRGSVPSYLTHLNGYSRNNNLPIQKHEKHMYDNLFVYINSDAARYVSELYTGMFLLTPKGQKLKRLISCKNPELLSQLTNDLATIQVEGVECDISYTDVQSLTANGINPDELAKFVQGKLHITKDYLLSMVETQVSVNRVVDIENLPFVLAIPEDDKDELTKRLQDKHVLSRVMFEYIIQLCCKAYDVNWGHTGAARAIPRFIDRQTITRMNDAMSAFLSSKLGKAAPNDAAIAALYSSTYRPDDDDDDESDDTDEAFAAFDYYVTDATRQLMKDGQLDSSYMTSEATGAESAESSIVEYWRKCNGDNNLHYFLSSVFMEVGEIQVLLEAFYKLMRWGELKPTLLVFDKMPEVRTVFDLNAGREIPNTAIVDESQLVMVNGCKHTLAGMLFARDVTGPDPALVGFMLCKDYGVKKYVLASWVDVGEMMISGEVDIADFKSVSQVKLKGDTVFDITSLEGGDYSLFASNRNIESGLAYGIPPTQLSELALLMQPGVTKTAEFLKSKQASMVVTTKDRQYQILNSYINVIRAIYNQEAVTLSKDSAATTEIAAVASQVYEMFISGVKEQAPDANAVRANQAIASMNLDDGQQSIEFSDAPLIGKFAIISDMDMQSGLPPIEFTDVGMQRLSQRLRNRIVLLILETGTELILCRKDITQDELLINDKKIEHRKFNVFAKVFDGLKQGRTLRVNDAKTGLKKIARLHSSLQEFV